MSPKALFGLFASSKSMSGDDLLDAGTYEQANRHVTGQELSGYEGNSFANHPSKIEWFCCSRNKNTCDALSQDTTSRANKLFFL